jgi:hypothetical protein
MPQPGADNRRYEYLIHERHGDSPTSVADKPATLNRIRILLLARVCFRRTRSAAARRDVVKAATRE